MSLVSAIPPQRCRVPLRYGTLRLTKDVKEAGFLLFKVQNTCIQEQNTVLTVQWVAKAGLPPVSALRARQVWFHTGDAQLGKTQNTYVDNIKQENQPIYIEKSNQETQPIHK